MYEIKNLETEEVFNIDDEMLRVLETDMFDFMDWIKNAINEKHRWVIDQIIDEDTTIIQNPRKMAIKEKIELVRNKPLISGKEKNAEAESLMS